MAANVKPIFELTGHITGFPFVPATATTKEVLFTAGTNGSRIDSISVCSDDTSDRDLAFYINDGTTDYYIGNVHVPLGSGYTTVAKVEGLVSLMPSALQFIFLPATYTLKANMVVAVTTALTVTALVIGGDY